MNSAVGPITEFKSENNYKHWSMQTIMSSSSNHYCCRRFRACCKLSYCRFTPFPLCFLFHNVFHYRAKPSAVYRCISSRIQKCNMPFMLLFLLLFLHQFILLFCHLLFSPPPASRLHSGESLIVCWIIWTISLSLPHFSTLHTTYFRAQCLLLAPAEDFGDWSRVFPPFRQKYSILPPPPKKNPFGIYSPFQSYVSFFLSWDCVFSPIHIL